jgi:hypothetical protein
MNCDAVGDSDTRGAANWRRGQCSAVPCRAVPVLVLRKVGGGGVIAAAVVCTQVARVAFQLICCNEIPNALIFGRVAVGIKGVGRSAPSATCQLCGVCITCIG